MGPCSPELGRLGAGAFGRDERDAIARAADLIESETCRRIAERERSPAAAARPSRRRGRDWQLPTEPRSGPAIWHYA